MKNFTHLHLHTEYSLLDGFARIHPLMEKAKAMGMTAVAMTDHGVMFGAVEFYKAAKKHGLKPIIGCEVYTAARKMSDRDNRLDKNSGHLVLLAKNNQGYQNLIKLVSEGYVHGFYYKPRIDYDLLREHTEGLIALSACLSGDVQQYLLRGMPQAAEETAIKLKEMFGPGNFYLELQDHGIPEQKRVNMQLIQLSKKLNIPLVATNDVHYLEREDASVHDILLCIQTGKNVSDQQRMRFPSQEFYFKSQEEMHELFSYVPEALENTMKIAEACNMTFDFETRHLPEFDLPEDVNHASYLKDLCLKGLRDRYDQPDLHMDRLMYELNTIEDMGFSDYFLIVWDFIKYAKDQGILVGPGRGSVGGSIVAYVLNITDVDPMKYDLIFERFLNPERVTMPDIDIDFEDSRRQEVIDYVIDKYGKDHVSQIITFGTMAAKAALRDVARVVELPYHESDKLAKAVPFALGMTLDKALKLSPEFHKMYAEQAHLRKVIQAAKAVEGVPRHASTHAAGVVVAKHPVDHYVPLYVQDDNITTQYSMTLLEEIGLLKMDFLGLRTLKVIKDTLVEIHKTRPDFDFSDDQYMDRATFDLIGRGDTLGVFQLESAGMIRFMKDLKPTSLEDIIAGISLYRPGPMDSIPRYIANKNQPGLVTYLHPKLEGILDVTYGCIVYQEQVMRIVRELGGFSYGRADIIRKAMSKKNKEIMQREKALFIHGSEKDGVMGCVKNGVPAHLAEQIFDEMEDFGKYAFNKSHAAGYGIIAFQTAYLKTHYPVAFMAATMTSMLGNHNRIAQYIQDCHKMGIEILPPSINKSFSNFTVEEGKIRYSLRSIKNVGRGIIKSLVKERPFTSFEDFCEKVDEREINKRAVESMIKAGVFDEFGQNRAALLATFEKTIDGVVGVKRRNAKGQISLFAMTDLAPPTARLNTSQIKPLNEKVKLNFEKEVMGLYLSGHPLQEFKTYVEQIMPMNLNDLHEAAKDPDFQRRYDDKPFTLAGMIAKRKNMTTKAGKLMCFLEVEDLFAPMEVIVFPKVYDRVQAFLTPEAFVMVTGRLSFKEEEEPKLLADNIMVLNKENAESYLRTKVRNKMAYKPKRLFLKLAREGDNHQALLDLLGQYPGAMPVVLYFSDTKKKMIAPKTLWVKKERRLMESLVDMLGKGSVVIQ